MFNVDNARIATYNPELVFPKSHHQCAKSVRQFIEAGGLSTNGRPISACQYVYFLPTIGFSHIATLTGRQTQQAWTRANAQVGDIAVMNHDVHGHICMWNGDMWVSDFKQPNGMWVYKGEGTCFVFRYTGVIQGAVDFSGYSGMPGGIAFGSVSSVLAEKPTSAEVTFVGLYNLYRYQSLQYQGPSMIRYTQSGEIILGDATPGETGLSNFMFNYLAKIESGGSDFGFDMPKRLLEGYDNKDAKGHKTYGYGSLFFDSQHYMDQVKPVWSQQELEQVFINSVTDRVNAVKAWATKNNVSLNQNQLDSIVSACYNFGNGFLNKQISRLIIQNPNDPRIPEMWAHLSDTQAANGQRGLKKRREEEAQWYSQGA